jgi:hypothetical protein
VVVPRQSRGLRTSYLRLKILGCFVWHGTEKGGGRQNRKHVSFGTWNLEVSPLTFKPRSGWRVAYLVVIET